MKKAYVSITYLELFEYSDDTSDEDIEKDVHSFLQENYVDVLRDLDDLDITIKQEV